MTEKYTPSKGDYITLQGKKYLPARRRVQWFRGEHPDWTINSSVVELNWTEGFAIIRAEILDDTGRLIASGMKSETRKGFADFVEKAETGAIARAVAIAGYGTEDALDLDEGEHVADSPVTQPERTSGGQRAAGASPSSQGGRASSSASAPVQTDGALRDAVAAAAAEHHVGTARLSLIADAVGVPKGQRANADQLRAILAYIETPPSEGSPAPAGSDAATTQGSGVEAVSPGTPPDPAPAQTLLDEAVRIAEAPAEVPA